jgi:hypothetical protein
MPYTPHNKRKAKQPPKSQRDGFEWATLLTAIIGVAVVAVSTGGTFWMAVLMNRQLGAMRDQQIVMESQQRPWLTVSIEAKSAFTFTDDGSAHVLASVRVKNVGQAAATGIYIETAAVEIEDEFGSGYRDIILAQVKLCSKLKAESYRTPDIIGFLLFPNEETTSPITINIPAADVSAKGFVFGAEKRIRPVIVGCADYQFYASPTHHQTRFANLIKRLDPLVQKMRETPEGIAAVGRDEVDIDYIPPQIGGIVEATALRFPKSIWGNGYAD